MIMCIFVCATERESKAYRKTAEKKARQKAASGLQGEEEEEDEQEQGPSIPEASKPFQGEAYVNHCIRTSRRSQLMPRLLFSRMQTIYRYRRKSHIGAVMTPQVISLPHRARYLTVNVNVNKVRKG
jgi:hypothetical protein